MRSKGAALSGGFLLTRLCGRRQENSKCSFLRRSPNQQMSCIPPHEKKMKAKLLLMFISPVLVWEKKDLAEMCKSKPSSKPGNPTSDLCISWFHLLQFNMEVTYSNQPTSARHSICGPKILNWKQLHSMSFLQVLCDGCKAPGLHARNVSTGVLFQSAWCAGIFPAVW